MITKKAHLQIFLPLKNHFLYEIEKNIMNTFKSIQMKTKFFIKTIQIIKYFGKRIITIILMYFNMIMKYLMAHSIISMLKRKSNINTMKNQNYMSFMKS
jgi:hypothetical protein